MLTTKQLIVKILAKTLTITEIDKGLEASCEVKDMSKAEYFMIAKDKNLKILKQLKYELRGARTY